MTSLTQQPTRPGQHRARRTRHEHADRIHTAIRTSHAPVGRVQAGILGFAAGLLTSGLAAALTLWIGA